MWNSHRFQLVLYCLNNRYEIRTSHRMSGSGAQLIPIQRTSVFSKSGRQLNGASGHTATPGSVTNIFFHCRVCWYFIVGFFFKMHNYSRVLRNQTVSEKVTLQHLPTLITWETLSHYTDIPPSSRLCLVSRKKQIRKTHSIAVLEKGKEKNL